MTRRQNRRHQAEYRARCRAAGVCKECGAPALPGRLRRAECDEAIGLQPVQSADESLTLIERQLYTLRCECEQVMALRALCDSVRERLESAQAQGRREWGPMSGPGKALADLRREREER